MKYARSRCVQLAILISVGLVTFNAFAWGERGHDLVTRVAVQNLRALSGDDPAVVTPFLQRDHMLAHLSNVPDIVWRAPYMSEADRRANYATHFINLEKVYSSVELWSDLPRDFLRYQTDAKSKGQKAEDVGTAPWRAMQLYGELMKALIQAGSATDSESFEDSVNQALLHAGLMSHFVGDLANPHHTTANYDGQLTGQKGLHAYFESDVVAQLPMTLASEIQKQAGQQWLEAYDDAERKLIWNDPEKLVWALLANSHRNLPRLLELDEKVSLLKRSDDTGRRAERKAPNRVAGEYQSFAVQRLGVGASALSRLWMLAWQAAGSPDLSSFRSYDYPVRPDFIDPNYIPAAVKADKKAADNNSAWRPVALDNLLVMELEEGQILLELAPQFAPMHVANIQLLIEQGYFDGTAVIRSQENYVAQWGDPAAGSDAAKSQGKAKEKIRVEFFRDVSDVNFIEIESRDAYADKVGFTDGFPTASDGIKTWLTHCNGMLGVSRGMGDDSGNGSGLYVVTGHAPRHLDRNVTLVGRVIRGMEYLSTLPRGTGSLGFYESPSEHALIKSVSLAKDHANEFAGLQIMRTDSEAFAKHVAARTTRSEEWFLEPTGRIELCNVAVPMRDVNTNSEDK